MYGGRQPEVNAGESAAGYLASRSRIQPTLIFGCLRESSGDFGELLQGRLQVVGDFLGDDVRRGQRVGVRQALVLDPEQVQAQLVSLEQVFVGIVAPAPLRVLLAPRRLA